MSLPDLDNEISELHSDEILIQITAQEQDLDRADALANLQAEITQAGAISRQDVMTAEAIAPGVLLDNYPRGGWTEERSTQNLKVSLEFMDKKMAVFAGIGVLGLLAAILRYFLKKDKSSDSSSGGGGVSSRDITESVQATGKAAADVTAATHDFINAFTTHPIALDDAGRKKFHALLKDVSMSEEETIKLVDNDAELRSWMKSKFMKQLVWSLVGNDLSRLIIDTHAAKIHTELTALLDKLIAQAPGLIKLLNDDVVKYLTAVGKVARAGTSLDWPDVPSINTTIFEDVKNYLIVAGVRDATSLSVNAPHHIAEALNKHLTELKEKLAVEAQRSYTDTLKDVNAFEDKVAVFLEKTGIKAKELVKLLEPEVTKLSTSLDDMTGTTGSDGIPHERLETYKIRTKDMDDYVKAGGKIITAIALLSKLTDHFYSRSQGRKANYITFVTRFKDLDNYIGR